jgi:POT family proton-dependent oligopeptide transporter
MLILGVAWIMMTVVAYSLASPNSLAANGGSGVSPVLVTPYWLISMYFAMTIAELFISPMGLAFVAKVAPPKLRGTMQGGWLAATAIGNMFSGLIGIPYDRLELWQTFGLLVITSFAAGGLMFLMLKKLEKAASS